MDQKHLEVTGLRTYFFTEAGVVKAVEEVTFDVQKGETLGLVGESGSGKTVTALSVLRIVPSPGKIVDGSVKLDGQSLLDLDEAEMNAIRGTKVAMIFQDPTSSLDPLFTIGSQLSEILQIRRRLSKKEAEEKTLKLLELVGIPDPEERANQYPHQFSGGMRQRVCVARAIALEPELLFADEPTTNLDVTIQAQVLDLMKELKKRFGMSLVMITHDMGIVAAMAQRVAVLYAGQIFEIAETRSLFKNPKHPYTEALLGAVPRLDTKRRLAVIPGNIPNLINPPTGCRFHPRCKYAIQVCKEKVPVLEETPEGHLAACHRWKELNLSPGGDYGG